MKKKKASEQTVMAFVKAVYPEHTELAMTMFDEETCLQDATALIQSLRRQVAKQVIPSDVRAKRPKSGSQCILCEHYDMRSLICSKDGVKYDPHYWCRYFRWHPGTRKGRTRIIKKVE